MEAIAEHPYTGTKGDELSFAKNDVVKVSS